MWSRILTKASIQWIRETFDIPPVEEEFKEAVLQIQSKPPLGRTLCESRSKSAYHRPHCYILELSSTHLMGVMEKVRDS